MVAALLMVQGWKMALRTAGPERIARAPEAIGERLRAQSLTVQHLTELNDHVDQLLTGRFGSPAR